MISLKWKLIIFLCIAVGLLGVGYYVGSGMGAGDLQKRLKQAQEMVKKLTVEKEKLEKDWQSREKTLEMKVRSLNEQLKKKQKEVSNLENRIKELQAQRENLAVPDKPDDIVNGFRKLGFKSCSRVKKSK